MAGDAVQDANRAIIVDARGRVAMEEEAAVSVRELVRRSLGAEDDPWNLAVVQRKAVWDTVRMRHLLDSLLAGYPIGSLLLCRVTEGSSVLDRDRQVIDARKQDWQLLDGQQRIHALVSMLTDRGSDGTFYLHMTMRREPPSPVQNKDRLLRYIAWQPEGSTDEITDRGHHVDLSRWYGWAEGRDLDDLAATLTADNVAAYLRDLDEAFDADLSSMTAATAVQRLRDLVRVWLSPVVPVLRAEVATPLDVLEVFTRINMGGVQVIGSDVFLAAVKTFWRDAERSLDRVDNAAVLLDGTIGALRFVARLASRGLGHGDVLRLSVDRLGGRNGQSLIDAMQQLTDRDSVVLARLANFSRWIRDKGSLGYALRQVSPELWDEVFAWAAASRGDSESWYVESQDLIEGYLVGGTLFRYPAIIGDRYRRAAFLEALKAGDSGERFPLKRILGVVRGGENGLHGSGQMVRGLGDIEEREVADQNMGLLIAIAEEIPYAIDRNEHPSGLDWDHIFPQAGARRMWAPGATGHHRQHPYRRFINSGGNLWLLDALANRHVQDRPPTSKFAQLIAWASQWHKDGQWYKVFPGNRWSVTNDERERFEEVDRLLNDDAASVDRGMTIFRDLVQSRSLRLLRGVLERFPHARDFAADTDVDETEPSPSQTFAGALGLTIKTPDPEPVLPLSDEERRNFWNYAVRAVTSQLKIPGDPTAHAKRHHGFDYGRFVRIGEPGEQTHFAVGIVTRFPGLSTSPMWVQVNSDTDQFRLVEARLYASKFASSIHAEQDPNRPELERLWIPLDAASLEYNELVQSLFAQTREIREVITAGVQSKAIEETTA